MLHSLKSASFGRKTGSTFPSDALAIGFHHPVHVITGLVPVIPM